MRLRLRQLKPHVADGNPADIAGAQPRSWSACVEERVPVLAA